MLFHMFRLPPFCACAAMAVAACLIAAAVLSSATVVWLDGLVGAALRTHAADPLFEAGWAVTHLGATDVVMPATAAGVVLLLALRLWHGALALLVAVASTQAVVQLAKVVVERPRPAANEAAAHAGGFSFPSGHSATAAALFGVLALVAARHASGRARWLLASAGVALMAAVGVSRVLLGAHYPTDVLAGWLTGGALALACVALFTRARNALARRTAAA